MKNTVLKAILFFVLILTVLLIAPNIGKAVTTVTATDEETLNNAIQSTDAGATIEIQNNITVTKPITVTKQLTI